MFGKQFLLAGAAASALLLASCGGSNDPNGTPTPTPSGTATATPTPTPTAATDISFANDFAVGSTRVYIYAFFTPNGGMEVFNDASRTLGSGGVSFALDPEVVLFGFPDLPDPVEFDAADLTSATNVLRTYEDGDESLWLELPTGSVLRATYERNQAFISGTEAGNLRSQRVVLIADPVTTTDPIDTDISFGGQPLVVGGTLGTTDPAIVSAPARTFQIDEATQTLTGTIQVFEEVAGTPTLVAELAISEELETNGTFDGVLTDTAFGFEGAFAGSLAGPDREELLFVFSASHSDGRKYVGSFIGEQP